MSEQNAFKLLAPRLLKMKFDKVRRPDMPVKEAVHEGYCTLTLLQKDCVSLTEIGYDTDLTLKIEQAIGAFAVAEAKLVTLLGEKEEAVKRWRKKRTEGYLLRKHLIDTLKFACRNDREALSKLKEFRRRPSQAVMILDLHTLAKLALVYEKKLRKINFNMDQIDHCIELAESLGRLYAESFCADKPCQMREIRNRAFTLLKKLIAEARAYVTYLFKGDAEKMRLYSSTYRRRKYRKGRKRGLKPTQPKITAKTSGNFQENSVPVPVQEPNESFENPHSENPGSHPYSSDGS
ncbi:hypothetical protein CHISP_3412 [Chitinispirillum alkaliphilum]|nr:hypothetical protein CHISP_3412 [Chitinispirillum alkaliphilum]